jgi:conjugative relaxase-like TrwC/TraI family protein
VPTASQRHRVRHQDVLSLAKLAGTDRRYFLDQTQRRVDHTESVSSGAEDYYLSGPEAAGEWTGSASLFMGLGGPVSEGALRGVLTKHDPRNGQLLEGSVRRARVPGVDLMFSVPKSASILFEIGDAITQRAVLDAQAAAVAEALRYLERHACRTRRGAGGYEIMPGDGFVGAAFKHRTSRAGDPQIHTHVLVANATRIHDGTWGSLDGRALYAEARTAGFIHEAVFRRELSERLGVSWTEPRNGIAEIVKVSAPSAMVSSTFIGVFIFSCH